MADRVIRYRGEFDASNILASLKNIRSEMQKNGADSALFGNVDKDIQKAESLMKDLQAQIKTGFRNQKDIDNFDKKFQALNQTLSKVNVGLGDIAKPENFKIQSKELDDLKKQIQDNIKAQEELGESAKKAVEGFTTKAMKKELNEAIESGEKLEETLKKVGEQQFTSRQGTLSKRLSKFSSDEISNAMGTGEIGNNLNLSSKGLTEYQNALKAIAVQGQDVRTVFEALKNNLDDNDRKLLEASDFTKQYTGDIATLIEELKKVPDKQLEAGNAKKALKEMTYAGAVDLNGEFQVNESSVGSVTKLQEEYSKLIPLQERLKQLEAELAVEREKNANIAVNGLNNIASEQSRVTETTNNNIVALKEEREVQDKINQTFDSIKNTITRLTSLGAIFSAITQQIKETSAAIQDLDKAFAQIAMVTDFSIEDMWSKYTSYATIANDLGQNTLSVVQASGLYFQQGLNEAEALDLTASTMKLATLAGLDFEQATSLMTSAVRGFHMEMSEGEHVTDVYSELAAHAAASVEDIANAMSRTAAIANSAGMEFETTSAMLTTMIEATQESPETLGTAMKTVVARFTELKNNVSALDSEFDDLDYNKVDTALKSIGVSLKDTNGQFRDIDDVFLEVSERWDTLDRNTQRYIATTAAGSRQQSRFIALMENYKRTTELIETAQDSAGRSSEQFAKYQDTLENKVNKLKNSWEQLRLQFLKSDFLKDLVDKLNNLITTIGKINPRKLVALGVIGISIGKTLLPKIIEGLKSNISGASNKLETFGEDLLGNIFSKNLNLSTTIKEEIGKIKELTDENLKIKIDTTDSQNEMTTLRDKISILKTQIEQMNNVPQAERNNEWKQSYNQLNSELSNTIEKFQRLEDKVQKNNITAKTNQQEIDKITQELKKNESLKKEAIEKGQTVGTALGTAIMTAATSILTDQSPVKTIGATFIAGISAIAPSVISAVSTAAAEAGTAGGGTFLATFIASSGGIGLIVVAITAALAGLIALGKNLINTYNDTHKSLENQISDSEALLKLEKQRAEEAQNTAKEEKNKLETAEEQKEELEQLMLNAHKTVEEQERMTELVAEIRESYQGVITYYNQGTGEIKIQNELWEELIKKQKESAVLANDAAVSANIATIGGSTTLDNLNYANKNGLIKKYDQYANMDEESAKERINRQISNAIYNYNNAQNSEKSTTPSEAFRDSLTGSIGIRPEELAKYFNIEVEDLDKYIIENKEAVVNAIYDNAADINDTIAENRRLEQEQIANAYAEGQGKGELETSVIDKVAKTYMSTFRLSSISEDDYSKNNAGGNSFFNQMGGAYSGATGSNAFSKWDKLTDDNKISGLEQYGIKSVKDVKTLLKDSMGTDEAEKFYEENRKSAEGQEEIFNQVIAAAINNKLNEWTEKYKMDEDTAATVEEKFSALTEDGISNSDINLWETFLKGQDITEEARIVLNQQMTDLLNEARDSAKEHGISDAFADELNSNTLSWFSTFVETSNEKGIKGASEFANQYIQTLKDSGIKEEDWQGFLNYDWSALSAGDYDSAKAQFIKDQQETLGEAFDLTKVETAFEQLYALNENYGNMNTVISNSVQLETYINKLQEEATAFQDIAGTINTLQESQDENGITLVDSDTIDTLNDFANKMKEDYGIDLNIEEVYEYDKATNQYKVNVNEIKKIYEEKAKINIQDLETEKKKTQTLLSQKIALLSKLEEEKKKHGTLNAEDEEQLASLQEEVPLLQDTVDLYDNQISKAKQFNNLADSRLNKEEDIYTKIKNTETPLSSLVSQYKTLTDEMRTSGHLSSTNIDSFATSLTELNTKMKGIDASKVKDLNNFLVEQDGVVKLNQKSLEEYIDTLLETLLTEDGLEEENYALYLSLLSLKQGFKEAKDAAEEANQEAWDTYNSDVQTAYEEWQDALDTVTEKEEALAEAQQDVIDKEEELLEKEEALQEIYYGTDNHKNKLDYLYNYTTELEQLESKAKKAAEALDDLQPDDDVHQKVEDYKNALAGEIANYKAQNEVIKQYIENQKQMLNEGLSQRLEQLKAEGAVDTSTNVSDFYYEKDGRWYVDYQKLNAAKLPDDVSDFIEEQVDNMNKYAKSYEDNLDKIEAARKEFEQRQKAARDKYIEIENKVVELLKKKDQEELDSLKNKYDGMKAADDEYTSALEESIKKQRDLRNQANQWDDLAEKEKKLSLQQRDTSGANAKEIKKTQDDITKTRESLLDNAVDNIVNNLKELYAEQEETRQAEIEYRQAILDNKNYVDEATAIINNWENAQDALDFFMEMDEEFNNASDATFSKLVDDVNGYYENSVYYYELAGQDFEDVVQQANEEANEKIENTSETLTSESGRALDETMDKVHEAQEKGREEVEAAKQAVEDAKDKVVEATQAVADALEEARKKQEAYNEAIANQPLPPTVPGGTEIPVDEGRNEQQIETSIRSAVASLSHGYRDEFSIRAAADQANVSKEDVINWAKTQKHGIYKNDTMQIFGNAGDDRAGGAAAEEATRRGDWKAFKEGGLVDFTGPAWVDGTTSKPEAFLSAAQTEAFSRLADNLQAYYSARDSISARNWFSAFDEEFRNQNGLTGDPIFNIDINVENISSDYDVDQMVERVHEDILSITNEPGTMVVLNK